MKKPKIMFEKFRQLAKLKQIQDLLLREKIEVEREGVKVVLNGKMEIEKLELNSELPKERQEIILKDCFNEALSKLKRVLAQKFSQEVNL